MGICTPGSGIGLPTAHIPVDSITAAAFATMIMGGYYCIAALPSLNTNPPTEPAIPPDQATQPCLHHLWLSHRVLQTLDP
jgi:hypothetical protein